MNTIVSNQFYGSMTIIDEMMFSSALLLIRPTRECLLALRL